MRAYILAGGEGTRLRPYTYTVPKPMLRLGGKPIMRYVIENLKRCGIRDIIITCGYRHEQITSYFGEGNALGVKVTYSIEKEKMNTAGSVLHCKERPRETFVVAMGDHLTNIDIGAMVKQHKKSGAIATVALYRQNMPLEYGVATVQGNSIIGLAEKPVLEHLYNTAIYLFEPEIFNYIKEKEDFAKDVIPRLLAEKRKVDAYIFDDVWFDIGRVSDYERFREIFDISRLLTDLKG